MRSSTLAMFLRSAKARLARGRAKGPRRRAARRPSMHRLTCELLEERALLSGGDLDLTFGGDGKITTDFVGGLTSDYGADVAIVAQHGDGKIVVAGTSSGFTLARYNSDGSLDTSFASDGKLTTGFGSEARALAVQPDGKIVVAGDRSGDCALARFNTDGSLDTSFDGDGKVTTSFPAPGGLRYNYIGQALAIQSDGKLLAAGYVYQSGWDFTLIRYNSDGSLDTSFDGDGKVITDLGSVNDYARALAIQADGKIVVAGGTGTLWPEYQFALARYNSDGSLDTSFDGDGKVITNFGSGEDYARALAIQADGKIVAAGSRNPTGENRDFAIARYNSDGSLDSTFDGDGKATTDFGSTYDEARGVAIQPDGKIVAAGRSGGDFGLARYNSNGSLDTAFDGDGKVTTDFASGTDEAWGIAIQADGKIVAVGTARVAGSQDFALARYKSDGSLDSTFDTDGKVTTNFGRWLHDVGRSVMITAEQPDGKIIVAGTSSPTLDGSKYFALARYNSDGSLDTTFGIHGQVTTEVAPNGAAVRAVALQPDGKIVVAGYAKLYTTAWYWQFALVRYNSDGSLDTSFDGDGIVTSDLGPVDDYATAVAIQGDGKIVVAGYSAQYNTGNDFTLARYNSDGSLDTSFDGDGKVTTHFGPNDYAAAMAIQGDGKIVVAGYASQSSTGWDMALARYNSDGSLDTSLDTDGKVTTDFGSYYEYAADVAIQADGKIVLAGSTNQNSTAWDFALARYHGDGSLDTGFDVDGRVTTHFASRDEGQAVAIQSDGKIVVAGLSFQGDTGYDFALARYNSDGSLNTRFGEDGKVTTDFGSPEDVANAVAIQPDGRIVAAGYSIRSDTGADFALARYQQGVAGNSLPVADPSGPYVIHEGESLTLDGSGSSDPDEDPLTYFWDVNGDGTFSDATGQTPTLTWSHLTALGISDNEPTDGSPRAVPLSVLVHDGDGGVSFASTTLTVLNTAPTVSISGASDGVRGQTRTFVLGASDPSAVDRAAGFTYQINWGDGSPVQVIDPTADNGSGITVDHVFTQAGSYTVEVTATDKDGGSGVASLADTISVVELQVDACDPAQTALAIGGTLANDTIQVNPSGNSGDVEVFINGQSQGVFHPTGRILAFAQAGDDEIQVAASIPLAAWLYGGAGSDRLKGGAGNDVLLGENGDDLLVGGDGRDLIIGGYGADRIVGNADDDVLISGITLHDADPGALSAIMDEWTRTDMDYLDRIAILQTGTRRDPNVRLDSDSVFLDGDKDVLTGSSGLDWFLFDQQQDRATDLKDEVFANDLTWILA